MPGAWEAFGFTGARALVLVLGMKLVKTEVA